MEKLIVPFTSEQRAEMFINTSSKLGINSAMAEKDFWVYSVLDKIFNDEELSQILCFKGGTSLSKIFKVIERFSEDIDLILLQEKILKPGEELERASTTQQQKFNQEVEARAELYINNELKHKIAKVLGETLKVLTDEEYNGSSENIDKHVLHIIYPRALNDEYLRPTIKLEIGPLSLWNPNEKYPLSSYVADQYPHLGMRPVMVPTIKAERTFWEKITILHAEHYRPEGKKINSRYARHYYDVFRLGNSDIKAEALNNFILLDEVAKFKKRFYPSAWARYDDAHKGTIRLYPAEHNLDELKRDYAQMQDMIFGNRPSWEEILEYLKELELEINKP